MQLILKLSIGTHFTFSKLERFYCRLVKIYKVILGQRINYTYLPNSSLGLAVPYKPVRGCNHSAVHLVANVILLLSNQKFDPTWISLFLDCSIT